MAHIVFNSSQLEAAFSLTLYQVIMNWAIKEALMIITLPTYLPVW